MPKSRFNAVREKARASRHNPLNRKDGSSNQDGNTDQMDAPLTLKPITGQNGNADVLPVLKALPLPNATSSSSHEDALWALTSLNGFWSTKALRNELLAPKHDIVSRILVQLQNGGERPIEVRDAASGCLRNLCIEAAGKARKALESKDSINICIAEICDVARALSLVEGDGNETVPERRLQNSTPQSFLNKPKEDMNRKERRHAAKAEAAAAKKQGQGVGKEESSTAKAENDSMNEDSTPAIAAQDDHTAIRCSHLNNIAAVIWCLAEMSPQAADECGRAAAILGRIFSQATRQGVEALNNLQKGGANGTVDHSANGKVDVGKKDQKVIDKAWIEASTTCLNALVTLSDSNAHACAALVGISKPELMSAIKGKGKVAVIIDEEELTRVEGQKNVQSLCCAVEALYQYRPDSITKPEGRQLVANGLLALAALRNIQSSLPLQLRKTVKVETTTGQVDTLSNYESSVALAAIQQTLLQYVSTGTKAEDASNVNLALEVLAELVGDRERWNVYAPSSAVSKTDDLAVDEDESEDEEMDVEEGDGAEGGSSSEGVEDEEMILEEEESGPTTNGTIVDFHKTQIAKTFSPSLLEPLCKLAFDIDSNSAALTDNSGDATSATIERGVAIRALSVLGNAILVLASYAQPPPSQPVEDATHKKRIASFQKWLSEQNDMTGRLWRWSFEMACRAAASPIVAVDEASQSSNENVRAACVEGKRIIESSLGIMWSLTRCFEGVEGPQSNQILLLDNTQFAQDPHCIVAGSGTGVIESVMAAYKGSTQDAKATSQEGESTLSISDPTTWASTDGIRVHCLGLLSTLCRQGHVWQAHLSKIVTLLEKVLEALPPRNAQKGTQATLASLEVRDWTSYDGMVIAVNGLIDTFADETKPWDQQYKTLKLHGKLKRHSAEIRHAARSIDKRKQASLRIAADEAWENLMGFLSYRESVKAT
ncbi:uncharacterized protein FA14DRAFT_160908 [Meira miltonrushii]|uniref:SYO1-like TPR repeats domain-containing protein n=1 Tax=Meira miltonrushii TaxID=1280837 RepID=A0A316VF81_9BASI|nr:uncharacterized protein FA14DRAFT_160908 [Meira miltonrushii]PWN35974.1 hypothetical protein FA14DRAFT_160908 [Meira miltonrushii]